MIAVDFKKGNGLVPCVVQEEDGTAHSLTIDIPMTNSTNTRQE